MQQDMIPNMEDTTWLTFSPPQGRFLHGNVTLSALGLPCGKTAVMHLVPRERSVSNSYVQLESKMTFSLLPACPSQAHRTIFTGKRRLPRAAVVPSPAPYFRHSIIHICLWLPLTKHQIDETF